MHSDATEPLGGGRDVPLLPVLTESPNDISSSLRFGASQQLAPRALGALEFASDGSVTV